ncbi:hypothetical protein [Streptomyces sp. NBC_01320]|uniref:hypothetical protein n=1 Tax=Streptomyces sp. NBC_01320 TaxID=2903824 RepID=UPI002E0F0978|nr:hypothetical protein OG395_47730 [Streptomyces sp. NBC_01320]
MNTPTDASRRVRATGADIEAALLYRPGGLDSLQQLRDRGGLGPQYPARLTHRYEQLRRFVPVRPVRPGYRTRGGRALLSRAGEVTGTTR